MKDLVSVLSDLSTQGIGRKKKALIALHFTGYLLNKIG